MNQSQKNKILELLKNGDWICTSQMYALYMSDPRRRLIDLKNDGYVLESKKCELHDFHRGGSKMWKFIGQISHSTLANFNEKPKSDINPVQPLFSFRSPNYNH